MTASIVRAEIVDTRTYRVVSDGFRQYSAIVRGAVTDDATGRAPGAPISVVSDVPALRPWAGTTGRYGFAGDPALVFEDLSVPHTVTCTVSAPGYRPSVVAISIPANPVFPVIAPLVALRRLPVSLQGRVTNVNTKAPVAGAYIELSGGIPVPHPLLLRTPVALRHVAGTVQGMTMTPVALAPARTVVKEAGRGATTVKVNDRGAFAAGQIAQLGVDRVARYAQIAAVNPDPDDPGASGWLDVAAPLADGVVAGTPVLAFTAAPSGPVGVLARVAEAGEAVIALSGAMPTGRVVRISDAPQPDEYLGVGALTDASGYWQAHGVSYPVMLQMKASASGYPSPANMQWQVDFGSRVNVIDFQLKP